MKQGRIKRSAFFVVSEPLRTQWSWLLRYLINVSVIWRYKKWSRFISLTVRCAELASDLLFLLLPKVGNH